MNRTEAYEWLAPKLSLSEREVLDAIYNSPMDQSRMLSDGWRDARKETPAHETYCDIWLGATRVADCLYVNYTDDQEAHFYHNETDSIIPYRTIIAWRELPDPPAFA